MQLNLTKNAKSKKKYFYFEVINLSEDICYHFFKNDLGFYSKVKRHPCEIC